jgi:23S rRNA (cytosine1962-C5)-methyltransferase
MRSSSISKPRPIADRLASALRLRQPLARRTDLNTYRLVHGTADDMPGTSVDRFDDVLVVHLDDPTGAPGLVLALVETLRPRAVYVKGRPRQPGRLAAAERLTLAPTAPAWGEPADEVLVVEGGMSYQIRPGGGLSVGLFLDMRDVRAWVLANARARRVLNLFAYTCGFGVCASVGGAERVLNVDTSRSYLRWGQVNYGLNRLAVDTRDFVHGDALDWLGRLGRRGDRFDLVIIDPPSFGSTRTGTFSAEQEYDRLVTAAAQMVAAGGMLVAATNHGGISARRFDELIGRGLRAAERRGRRVQRWHEPILDFPVAPHAQPYLKIQALELD